MEECVGSQSTLDSWLTPSRAHGTCLLYTIMQDIEYDFFISGSPYGAKVEQQVVIMSYVLEQLRF